MHVFTIGHGARPAGELVDCLRAARVATLVDVRRFPGSRRHPQFNRDALAATLEAAGIAYRHAEELGGRRTGEPGEERYACIQTPAFRSYAARMRTAAWQEALDAALADERPCFMCAETPWWRCHRRLIAELLHVRGHEVLHLLGPHEVRPHRPWDVAETRDGRLFLCGELVA
ncbi:MAG: DUF488 domain-containing protein [Actinomycetota bacterium]|nr:DUF488 domain-containing protein [Actinomycetota bacterium]